MEKKLFFLAHPVLRRDEEEINSQERNVWLRLKKYFDYYIMREKTVLLKNIRFKQTFSFFFCNLFHLEPHRRHKLLKQLNLVIVFI